MNKVNTGLDNFRNRYWKKLKGSNLGLLSNQASLDSQLTPAKNIIDHLLPGQLPGTNQLFQQRHHGVIGIEAM